MVAGDPETVTTAEKQTEALGNTVSADIRRDPPPFTPRPDNKRIVAFTLALFWPTFRVASFGVASLILASIFFGWPSASVYVLVGLATAIALVPWNSVFWALVTLACLGVAIFTLIWYSRRTAGDQNKSFIFRAQESEKVDRRTTRNLTLGLFIGLAIIWACAILFAPWLLLLALMAIVFLSALRYWHDHPYSMGRVLGGITVGTLLLTAFMLRIWLDVNLWQTTGQNGMKFGEIDGAYRVEIPQRILVGSANQVVQIVPAAPAWASQPAARAFETYLQSPLAAPPAPAGTLAPLTATLPSGLPILAAIDAGPPMSIVVSPPFLDLGMKYGVAATSTFTTNLSHNLQYAPCEQVGTGIQQFVLWTDVILGGRCRWSTATLTVTLAAAEAGPRFPISATTELETIHGGRLRQFVTSNAVTQSPLLFFIPSLLAALAYVVNQFYVKEREQTVKEREQAAKEQEQNAREAAEADNAIAKYIDDLHNAHSQDSIADFDQLNGFHERGLVTPAQWSYLSYWNRLLAEPVLPPWDAACKAEFAEMLAGDPRATCGALQIRGSKLRRNETYYSMVAYVCDSRHGFDESCVGLLPWYNAAKTERQKIAKEPFLAPWPTAVVPGRYELPEKNLHAFTAKVGSHDPFCFSNAEEEFKALGPGGLFWPDHPIRSIIERSTGLMIVCGAAGSGKSALGYHLRAKYTAARKFAVRLPYLMNLPAALNIVAQDALKTALDNISTLSVSDEHRAILARFFVEMLGADYVVAAIARARRERSHNDSALHNGALDEDGADLWVDSFYSEFEQRVQAGVSQSPTSDPVTWLTSLPEIAAALKFDGFILLIDNVTALNGERGFRYLQSAHTREITPVLFTNDLRSRDKFIDAGFRLCHLNWTPEQLCTATCYRLNYLLKQPTVTEPGLLMAEELAESFFTEKAWSQLCSVERTPRRWFTILSYVLEHSSHAGRIDDDQIIQAINAT